MPFLRLVGVKSGAAADSADRPFLSLEFWFWGVLPGWPDYDRPLGARPFGEIPSKGVG